MQRVCLYSIASRAITILLPMSLYNRCFAIFRVTLLSFLSLRDGMASSNDASRTLVFGFGIAERQLEAPFLSISRVPIKSLKNVNKNLTEGMGVKTEFHCDNRDF